MIMIREKMVAVDVAAAVAKVAATPRTTLTINSYVFHMSNNVIWAPSVL